MGNDALGERRLMGLATGRDVSALSFREGVKNSWMRIVVVWCVEV